MNSRTKGKGGELEFARIMRNYGFDCHRGQQYCGANGDPDVTGLPGIHPEVKRNERLNIYDAIDQARRDARPNLLPVVFHRKNHCDWLVTMRLSDWIVLFREFVSSFFGGSHERK